MKKLSILIVLLTAISLLAVSIYAAQTAAVTVTASESTVCPGETVTVTVSVTSVENCAVGGFMFDYNKDVFEYVGGQALVSGYTAAGISPANGNLAGYFMDGNTTVEGDIFQITLKVKDDASYGDYTITGTPNIKSGNEEVHCSVTAATVTVEAASHTHTWDEGVVTVEPGKDTYGEKTYTCVCGETKTEEIPPLLRFGAYAINLQSSVQVNFKVKKEVFDSYGYTDAYAVFTMTGRTGATVTVTVSQDEARLDGNYYVFDYNGLPPDMFGDDITAVLYAKNNGVDYVSEPLSKNVKDYLYNQLANYAKATKTKDKNFRTLVVDLLNYGAAAQTYTKHTAGGLVNADLTETQKSWGRTGEVTATKDTNLPKDTFDGELLVWKAVAITLEDAVIPNASFEASDLTGITIKVTCAGTNREYSCTEALEAGLLVKEGARYRFYFKDIGVAQMREPIYFTAYKDGKVISQTLTYSVQSYCVGKLDASTDAGALLIAMLRYGDAAKAYVNS